jgi:hypothetical protein
MIPGVKRQGRATLCAWVCLDLSEVCQGAAKSMTCGESESDGQACKNTVESLKSVY